MSSCTIYKRELSSYFSQPTAYAIIVIFLIASMGLTFSFGRFIVTGDASLEWSFVFFHPWILMFLAPAIAMRLWADEQRNGTIELLSTFPVTTSSAIIGKFLAAATVTLVSLVLTFPIIITINYLGNVDNGAVFSSYLASYLVGLTFIAVTMLISACSRDQVVCLIVSVTLCVLMVLIGYDDVTRVLANVISPAALQAIVSMSVWDHFRSLNSGFFRFQDLAWFASIISVCLLGTSAILSAKRA